MTQTTDEAKLKNKEARKEAKAFIGNGRLRDTLKSHGGTISDEAIQKIIDACCFGLGI